MSTYSARHSKSKLRRIRTCLKPFTDQNRLAMEGNKRKGSDGGFEIVPAVKKARTDVVLYNDEKDMVEMVRLISVQSNQYSSSVTHIYYYIEGKKDLTTGGARHDAHWA